MQIEFTDDPIPSAVQELLALFKDELSTVSFPDVSQQALETLADDVRAKLKELQDVSALITAAQEALEASQNELVQKSIRGLAYAKIFAEGNDELMEKLSAISFGKPVRTPKPAEGKRSRSKKSEVPVEEPASEQASE
jgi:hypothetical protein